MSTKLAVLPDEPSAIELWRESDAERLHIEARALDEWLARTDDALEIAEAHDDELLGGELRRVAALVRDRRNEFDARARARRVAGR